MTILKGYIDNIDEVLVLVDKYGDNFIKMYNKYGNTAVTAYTKYGNRATFAFKNHSDDALDWLKKNYGEGGLNSNNPQSYLLVFIALTISELESRATTSASLIPSASSS